MIRFYLMTMFALPLLELWDRLIGRLAEPLPFDGAFFEKRWLTIFEGAARVDECDRWLRVWIVRIPWLRTWGEKPAPNFQFEHGFRKHWLIAVPGMPAGRRFRLEPPLPT